jgi:hypothetical protein
MQAQTFFKVITMDKADLLERLTALFEEQHIAYCVIGGQGVNAYVEPLVSLDLDPERHGSKRQKDLADIARLIEAYPQLRERVPAEIMERLV